MKLHIISPEGEKHVDISWIEVETPVGNFVIHSGHAPTLLALLPKHDILFQRKTGEREIIPVINGIAEITREKVTVIINK